MLHFVEWRPRLVKAAFTVLALLACQASWAANSVLTQLCFNQKGPVLSVNGRQITANSTENSNASWIQLSTPELGCLHLERRANLSIWLVPCDSKTATLLTEEPDYDEVFASIDSLLFSGQSGNIEVQAPDSSILLNEENKFRQITGLLPSDALLMDFDAETCLARFAASYSNTPSFKLYSDWITGTLRYLEKAKGPAASKLYDEVSQLAHQFNSILFSIEKNAINSRTARQLLATNFKSMPGIHCQLQSGAWQFGAPIKKLTQRLEAMSSELTRANIFLNRLETIPIREL